MVNQNNDDKNIVPSLIWLSLGIAGYFIYKNWIFLAGGVILTGVMYVRNN